VDTSFLKFSGVMEGWRLQTEYRIVADHFRRNKHLVNVEEENDGESGESGESERSGESKVASSRQPGVDKENPAFAVEA